MIDKSFWRNPSLVINKDVFKITFRQVVEVPTFPKETSVNSESDTTVMKREKDSAVNILSMTSEMAEEEKSVDEYANNPNDTQFEDKYNHLYNEYISIKKERNELKSKLEESEIRKDLTQKKDNATKVVATKEGYQLNHLLAVAGIFLLVGMILPHIIRLLL